MTNSLLSQKRGKKKKKKSHGLLIFWNTQMLLKCLFCFLYLAWKLLQGFLLKIVFARYHCGRNPGFRNQTTIVYGEGGLPIKIHTFFLRVFI